MRSICVGAPTTTMAYAEITSGTCTSNGLVDIPNFAACEAAAIFLVLGAADASPKEEGHAEPVNRQSMIFSFI